MRVTLSDDDAATVRKALSHAGAPADRIAALSAKVERLTAVLAPMTTYDGLAGEWPKVPTCPACGGQTFSYMEGCTSWIADCEVDSDGRSVTFTMNGWDDIGESYDGDPGLFCDDILGGGCGAPIDLPAGWEHQWD